MRAAPLLPWLLCGLSACGDGNDRIEAPAPARAFAQDQDSLAQLPPGIIVGPLSLDLVAPLAALERIVPRRIGNIARRIPVPNAPRKSYAFELRRNPFAVSFSGDTVILAAIIHYKGRAWYDPPIGPDLNGECGTRGEPPRARLVVHLVPRLSKSWRLQVRSRMTELSALSATIRDQCQVSILNVNVTDAVLTAAGLELQKLLPQLDRRLARLDIRTPLEKIWADLQKPIRLNDSLWVLLSPGAVHLGNLHASGAIAQAELGITASPRIVTGRRPRLRPFLLPPLGEVRTDQGFSLLIEGAFDYGVMSSELTNRLRGLSLKVAGGTFAIQKATVYGVGSGRLALGLDFDGTARGRVWLLGTPSYDATTGMLSVPDLDFDAGSVNLLMQGLAWLKGDAIREFLRGQAKISTGNLLAQIETLAVKELNREVAPGVRLSTTIEKSEPAGIVVRSGGLILRARAIGAARIDLGPELFRPKKAVRGER